MGCGSGKCLSKSLYIILMTIFTIQLLCTLQRQVFNFLGYMWTPIIGNFIHIIIVIIGIFGTYHYRTKFIAVYTAWSLLWLGWNVFVICLYLSIGILDRNNQLFILNMGTKNKSWWLENGVGCQITNSTWMDGTSSDASRPIPPEMYVNGCVLEYYYIEVLQAGVQCLLSLLGFMASCVLIFVYREEDDSSASTSDDLEFVKMRYKSPSRSSFRDNNLTYDNVGQASMSTLDQPPSYDRSISYDRTINDTFYSDRQSIRSKSSNKSKSSKHHHHHDYERREELPWVQITPSCNDMEMQFRH